MGRVPQVVRIATLLLLSFGCVTAVAQPANVSEAEDGHYSYPASREVKQLFEGSISPPEVAIPAEVDYREPRRSPSNVAPAPSKSPGGAETDRVAASKVQVGAERPASNEKRIFSITCYTLSGNTSSGHPTGPGVAAADWSILPKGTKIAIEDVGQFTVLDRGPRGRTVDIWMADADECRNFGRRSRNVTVID